MNDTIRSIKEGKAIEPNKPIINSMKVEKLN